MNESMYRILALMAGMVLGTVFFGGLWLTIRKAATAQNPAVLFLGSFLFRTAITLTGFYYISPGGWQRLLAALFGFIMARLIILRLTKTYEARQTLINV